MVIKLQLKIYKYYKIIILLILIIINLFFLINPSTIINYTVPYLLLNIITILSFLLLEIKIIQLKNYINKTTTIIQNELAIGDIKPFHPPNNIKDIKIFIDTINQIINYLNQKHKTAQEFNANVSHELKSPLTSLKTDLEYFLYYVNLSPEISHKIQYFIKKIDNLESITSQMLLVSNNNIENLNNSMQRIFLNEIILEALKDKQNLLTEKNITFDLYVTQAITLHGHKNLLKHAFLNILDNAIKYSSKNQHICIYLKKKKNFIYFIVKDSGIGIHKKDLQFIFHPYYRGINTTSTISGYGLGLSLASWIFELHNATIKIKSKHNYGSLVFVKFYLY